MVMNLTLKNIVARAGKDLNRPSDVKSIMCNVNLYSSIKELGEKV
jgi:hypothetical protein